MSSGEDRHSKSPEHRLAEIKAGFPYRMRVLWRHGGGSRLEHALHQRFAHQHREGEWFEFGDIDAVAAVSAAAVEFWDDGRIDRKKRAKRSPTPICLNGLWISYLARTLCAGDALCTAVDEAGQRCGNTVGGYGYKPNEKPGCRHVPSPQIEAIEFHGGWIASSRLQLDVVELDRWLRQRCLAHASPLSHMWCLPEWEALDVAKHQVMVYEQKPDWLQRTSGGV